MRYLHWLIILSLLLVGGCASNYTKVAKDQTLAPPSEEKSQFVFLRSSFVASAINATLYDVTDGEVRFLGFLNNQNKIAYEAEAGKRTFMVVSEAADFMEAETVPGKRYYAIATPRMGVWKARFSLWPIKTDPNAEYATGTDEFRQWKENTELVRITPEARKWFENHEESVKNKYKSYWQKWQQRPAQARERRTLHEDDGV
jgi:uncharacterized protein YcfL